MVWFMLYSEHLCRNISYILLCKPNLRQLDYQSCHTSSWHVKPVISKRLLAKESSPKDRWCLIWQIYWSGKCNRECELCHFFRFSFHMGPHIDIKRAHKSNGSKHSATGHRKVTLFVSSGRPLSRCLWMPKGVQTHLVSHLVMTRSACLKCA